MHAEAWVRSLSSLDLDDYLIAGRKAAVLGNLLKEGFLVAEGIVVLSTAFDWFLQHHDVLLRLLEDLSHSRGDPHAEDSILREVHGVVCGSSIPSRLADEIASAAATLASTHFAVRSSGVAEDSHAASWAGVYDSFLNVPAADISAYVLACWASQFSPAALAYQSRVSPGYSGPPSMAVLVQTMVHGDASGVAFSLAPPPYSRDAVLVEAVWGLGEGLVGGELTPDEYLLSRTESLILEKRVRRQDWELIAHPQLRVVRQDVKGLKSTAQKVPDPVLADLAAVTLKLERLLGWPCDVEWTRVSEDVFVLQCRPISTPTQTAAEVATDAHCFAPQQAREPEWQLVVSHSSDLFTQDLVLTGIHENCHLDAYGLPFSHPHIAYEHSSGNIYWWHEHVEIIESHLLPIKMYERLLADLEASRDAFHAFLLSWTGQVQSTRPDAHMLDAFFRETKRAMGTIPAFHLDTAIARALQSDGQNVPLSPVGTETTQAYRQLGQLQQRFSVDLADTSIPDALFQALSAFVVKYGYLGMKYFGGRPWTVWDVYGMLAEDMTSFDTIEPTSPESPSSASTLATVLSSLLRLRTEKWESLCKAGMLFREVVQRHFREVIEYDALLGLRLAETLRLLGHLDFPDRHSASSRQDFALSLTQDGVQLATIAPRDSPSGHARTDATRVLKGTAGAPGLATGKVKIILTPDLSYAVPPGAVLVAKMSTPDYLPAMVRAAAIITEVGGATTHAVLVAREAQKPCVVGIRDATAVLQDGMTVRVNGNDFTVEILSP